MADGMIARLNENFLSAPLESGSVPLIVTENRFTPGGTLNWMEVAPPPVTRIGRAAEGTATWPEPARVRVFTSVIVILEFRAARLIVMSKLPDAARWPITLSTTSGDWAPACPNVIETTAMSP